MAEKRSFMGINVGFCGEQGDQVGRDLGQSGRALDTGFYQYGKLQT